LDGCERRRNGYVATYRYHDVETGGELNDGTTLVFIDIERFNKSEQACDNLEDLWLYSIKNMSRQSSCPESVAGTEIEELFRQAELAKMTNDQRTSFELGVMSRNDMLNSFQETLEAVKEEAKAEATKIGRAEGLIEGRAEGHAEGRLEGQNEERARNARNFKELGVDLEIIATATGLTVEEIQSL
jgi:predicted transposase/invertase (TIGR01784 family)